VDGFSDAKAYGNLIAFANHMLKINIADNMLEI